MFKVGDRVILHGSSEQVYKVLSKESDREVYHIVSLYTDKKMRANQSDMSKTTKNPALLLETYGYEWRQNVQKILTTSKIRFKQIAAQRQPDITKFYVDAKKLSVAKAYLDDYYKNAETKEPTMAGSEQLYEYVEVDDDLDF